MGALIVRRHLADRLMLSSMARIVSGSLSNAPCEVARQRMVNAASGAVGALMKVCWKRPRLTSDLIVASPAEFRKAFFL